MTNLLPSPGVPLAERLRVAVATTALNTASRVARVFDDPLGALDAPGGPPDRLALHRSLLAAGPLVRSHLGSLSAGMVDEAVDRARATGRFASVEGRVCDARDLPFSNASFDVAVSTYALHHVPGPAKAVAELARVVASDGTVGIMTNGPGHLREIEAIRVEVFGEAGRYTVNRSFAPGDAAMMLIDHFGEVCWHRYDDALRVTNTDHVLDFITSSPPANSATPEQQRQLHELVLRGTTDGVFHVSKDTGCLVCRHKVPT